MEAFGIAPWELDAVARRQRQGGAMPDAERQRILLAIECPLCGTKGAAEYEQDEGLDNHKDRELLGVRGAFMIGFVIEADLTEAVYCAHCDVRVA